ncbi:unnamed protein product [Callosobruchus maculatus]|uniref:BESS domain-containing protein n=1 Tax=Callosobruchus maculatus TaxID=64391 RepID=A0A653BFF0_CALMS|nr:unnamed protein product [Callosobruchus maculatus]
MEESNCIETNDSEEDSDGKLKIAIESPLPRRKSPLRPTKSEKLIIEKIEDEFERRLEEKAAKVKLNATHVKNIIRHVVTNEHVLALVKKAENPNLYMETPLTYEPKLTRAKARELLSTVPAQPIPWTNKKPDSEVQALINDELPEDSDDDEYVPGTEDTGESESDRESSIFSDPPSVPPPTPPSPSPKKKRKEKKISYSEDGVFKIPEIKTKEGDTEVVLDETTIAKRTRSKLCLNDTPLERIEEAFIPPDIPPDFYDMECDNEINDDWMDFLKTFTRPLEEVVKAPEDEEHDPEYNILGDEDVSKIDKEELREELRIDKAVKITKKELNSLIDELLEYSDTYCSVEMNKLEQSFMADHPEESSTMIDNEESTIELSQSSQDTDEDKSVESENDYDDYSEEGATQSPEKMGSASTPKKRSKKQPATVETSTEVSETIKKLHDIVKESFDDKPYDQFGKLVASELRLLPQRQAILLQQEIQNCIIRFKLSSLEQQAPQCVDSAFSPFSNHSSTSTSVSPMSDDDGDVLEQVMIDTFVGSTK